MTLRDTKAGLKLAGFQLGLNNLINAVDAQPMFQFRVADKIDRLKDVKFRNGGGSWSRRRSTQTSKPMT
ncbi:MAG TPA: hypothetical protein VEW46_22170 [Pyrinomonadaceae bacterium]|nr:hypothetical protein [Pyrinomonadaceae bacterium]